MVEHTPTPWRVDTRSFAISGTDAHGEYMHVADVRGWGRLTGKGHGALGLSEKEAIAVLEANAAFILQAVNSHDALIAGIEELRDYLRREATKTDSYYTCYSDQAAYIALRLDDLLIKPANSLNSSATGASTIPDERTMKLQITDDWCLMMADREASLLKNQTMPDLPCPVCGQPCRADVVLRHREKTAEPTASISATDVPEERKGVA